MADWQTIAVGITVLAASGWLARGFVTSKKAAAGCGSGCDSCPAASRQQSRSPGGFVGLDALQSSVSTLNDIRQPDPSVRS